MKVLIAVDDSPESHHAVDVARQFFGADAHYSVLSVGERPPIFVAGFGAGGLGSATDLQMQLDAAKAAAEAATEHAAARLPGGSDTHIDDGHPGAAICEYAAQHDADVVVIGSRDRSLWERLFDPSVGRYVIDHAPCPVLVVR